MDKRFGYIVFLGLVIGAIFGLSLVPATGNTLLSIGLGALGGTFVGWFAAAAVAQKREGD
jgi:hypothetical protein